MLVLPCQVEKFVNCESTPNLSVTAEGNSFGESAYAVHWDPDHSPSSKYKANANYTN